MDKPVSMPMRWSVDTPVRLWYSKGMKVDCAFTDPNSHRFRAFRRLFVPQWEDIAELVTFVESLGGVRHAKWVFQWSAAQVRAYAKLRQHALPYLHDAIDYNTQSFGLDDGVAVLKAMQAGGYVRGRLPKVVRDVLREANQTISCKELGRMTGLGEYRVSWAIRDYYARKNRQIAANSAALGIAFSQN